MVTKNVQPNEVQNRNNRWPPHPVIDHPGTSIQFNFFVKKERIILTNSNILCCQIGINPEVTFVESCATPYELHSQKPPRRVRAAIH